jgi:hypothetical protein
MLREPAQGRHLLDRRHQYFHLREPTIGADLRIIDSFDPHFHVSQQGRGHRRIHHHPAISRRAVDREDELEMLIVGATLVINIALKRDKGGDELGMLGYLIGHGQEMQ